VEALLWTEGADAAEWQNVLYSLEKNSGHPLAEAVVAYLGSKAELLHLDNTESITGKGMVADYKGKKVLAGNFALIRENGLTVPPSLQRRIEQWENEAKTAVYFAGDRQVLAVIAIADPIKPTSAKAIRELHDMGIEVYLLTGDNRQTAAAVAAQVGIEQFRAGVMPADKEAFVQELQSQGKIVAMVGDGINDSQALARADVSIAMGQGSDIAMEVAKMTLMSSDLSKIPAAIRLSRNTVATIRQNLFWAFIYNLIGIPIAAGVLYPFNGFLLNPMIAGAAMALSSVSVVSNSLRLKWLSQ